MRNEQQFAVTFGDESVRVFGADRYRVENEILTFYEDTGPGTPEHAVASFPMTNVVGVVRTEPSVEYG